MRIPLLLALLVVSAAAPRAQPTRTAVVAGTVRNVDGDPLPGASVYLSGTTRGTSANADGRFRLEAVPPGAYRVVGSMVGFAPDVREVRLDPGAEVAVGLSLAPATQTLGDVGVEAERDGRWARRLAWFEKALLGESDNADSTRVVNPEVLDFRVRWGTLSAQAAAPLVIENRALGYRLTYDLHAFSASAASIRYDGDERFEEIEPASPAEAERWAAARVRAYRGSLAHLLQSLFAGTADAEGYSFEIAQEDALRRVARRPRADAVADGRRRRRVGDAPRAGPARRDVRRRARGAGLPPVRMGPRAPSPAGLRPAVVAHRRPRPRPRRPAGDARRPVLDLGLRPPGVRAPGRPRPRGLPTAATLTSAPRHRLASRPPTRLDMTALFSRLVLLAAFLPAVAAQPATLEGTVRDEDGDPAVGLSVYLSGTSRGDATDIEGAYRIPAVEPGTYRLVASGAGYRPTVQEITVDPGETVRTDLLLYRSRRTLGFVRVEAPRDTRWRGQRERFESALAGESTLADSVWIVNPEVLEFNERVGVLQAAAAKPLVLENRALGYRLTYDLDAFVRTDAQVRYEGTERFEPLDSASPAEAARWAAARARAYRGSLRHLLRALHAGTAEDEGFRLLIAETPGDAYTNETFSGPSPRARPVAARRLLERDRDGTVRLAFRGRLEVHYDEPEDPGFVRSAWFTGTRTRPADEQVSTLELRGGPLVFDAQGSLADPLGVLTRGYLAFERLADLLPADYVLPPATD